MNVLLLNMGADTGGVLIAIVRAFRDVPDWYVRSTVVSTNYIGYEPDLPWDLKLIRQHWLDADVVHLHHNLRAPQYLRLPRRPYIVEYHGTGFREQPALFLKEQRRLRALGVVSTLDLYLLAPHELEWLPVPVNVGRMRAMRRERDDGRVLIAHAPTNKKIKSTEAFVDAVNRLVAEGYPVDVDIIEQRPWSECLERKARADIYFDQVRLGYGCNALEAWGMGIPVVAGAADPTLDEMERRFGELPFYHATETTIYDALRELVESPELRQRYARIGHDYVRRYHDEPVVVEQLKALYQRAVNQHSQREEAA